MTDHPQQQDTDSGLVKRGWVRTSRRRGVMTEESLEGQHVKAAWIDPQDGMLNRAEGEVRRNDAGKLIIESGA